MLECKACGKQFIPHSKNKKYCSDACKQHGVQIAHQKYQQKKKQVTLSGSSVSIIIWFCSEFWKFFLGNSTDEPPARAPLEEIPIENKALASVEENKAFIFSMEQYIISNILAGFQYSDASGKVTKYSLTNEGWIATQLEEEWSISKWIMVSIFLSKILTKEVVWKQSRYNRGFRFGRGAWRGVHRSSSPQYHHAKLYN